MTKLVGAIDIGSNAVRMSCARLTDDRRVEIIDSMRSPVRLGTDVFERGSISPETLERLAETLGLYLRTFEQNGCTEIRTYATSAFRESRNQEEVLERIAQEGDIQLEAISGGKEALLLQRAVQEALDLSEGTHLLADLGGGSVEISVIENGDIQFAESFRVGTVRLLRMFGYTAEREGAFIDWLNPFLKDFTRSLDKRIKNLKVSELILTGGNAVAIGELAENLAGDSSSFDKNVARVSRKDFKKVKAELTRRGFEQRVKKLGLARDRADVIVSAAFVFDHLFDLVGADTLVIPDVGVRDGILAEMLEDYSPSTEDTEYQQIIRSAFHYARKYGAHLEHARRVQRLAAQIFDGMSSVHGYGHRERTYLEVAAIMHDIGRFVRPSNHHKHSRYLIQNAEVVGLTNSELKVIGSVARYHTRTTPDLSHPEYARLSKKQRALVDVLSAILRVADALDREHIGDVNSVMVHCDDEQALLLTEDNGDLLLAAWALASKRLWFEEVFGRRLVVQSEAEIGVSSERG